MRDYKDVWNEAYYEAEDEGLPEAACALRADMAVRDYLGATIDAHEGDR